jgi:hypothetical protein
VDARSSRARFQDKEDEEPGLTWAVSGTDFIYSNPNPNSNSSPKHDPW